MDIVRRLEKRLVRAFFPVHTALVFETVYMVDHIEIGELELKLGISEKQVREFLAPLVNSKFLYVYDSRQLRDGATKSYDYYYVDHARFIDHARYYLFEMLRRLDEGVRAAENRRQVLVCPHCGGEQPESRLHSLLNASYVPICPSCDVGELAQDMDPHALETAKALRDDVRAELGPLTADLEVLQRVGFRVPTKAFDDDELQKEAIEIKERRGRARAEARGGAEALEAWLRNNPGASAASYSADGGGMMLDSNGDDFPKNVKDGVEVRVEIGGSGGKAKSRMEEDWEHQTEDHIVQKYKSGDGGGDNSRRRSSDSEDTDDAPRVGDDDASLNPWKALVKVEGSSASRAAASSAGTAPSLSSSSSALMGAKVGSSETVPETQVGYVTVQGRRMHITELDKDLVLLATLSDEEFERYHEEHDRVFGNGMRA